MTHFIFLLSYVNRMKSPLNENTGKKISFQLFTLFALLILKININGTCDHFTVSTTINCGFFYHKTWMLRAMSKFRSSQTPIRYAWNQWIFPTVLFLNFRHRVCVVWFCDTVYVFNISLSSQWIMFHCFLAD